MLRFSRYFFSLVGGTSLVAYRERLEKKRTNPLANVQEFELLLYKIANVCPSWLKVPLI